MGIENPEALTNKSSEPAPVDGGPMKNVTVNDLSSETPETTETDELDDIVALLDRETHDGPGDLNDLPESNFNSYATDGVEKGETK